MPVPYDKDFRLSAIQMVQQHGRSIPDAAKNLGISTSCLRGWIKQSDAAGSPAELDTQAELQRLRAENARLRVEREILKKAATFFAKEQP
ncbi:MAG: transposase [Algisphaera sp.]